MHNLVDETEKHAYVRRMFNSISNHYDFLNHFLSLNVDRHWRKRAIKISGLSYGETFLDVACGTGDLSIEAAKREPAKIVAIDFAENMLQGFRSKINKLKLDCSLEMVQTTAENLPFLENTFDVAAAAFGVRNFANVRLGLAEMYRVLKRGGRIIILEFSKPQNGIIRQIYFFYFKRILPALGGLISGDPSAYSYLPNSVSAFPDGGDFENIIKETNFCDVRSFPLTFGIATVYFGVKKV
jgi:demethylmenaquinone methyltransferase/2-methoxy-6-polyprenyl-1,4-benzoquinol methylase